MLNIIDNIINISKIESNQIELYIEESNINDQIKYIYSSFKTEIEGKKIQFICENLAQTEKTILNTDPAKLEDILTNLINNASKYTNKGVIEVGYTTRKHNVEFFVRDTGIGIPKARQEAIFERFIQADILDKMALQGAGLGLSISKAYVKLLGGNIWVESEEGVGSTFYFTLPYDVNSKKKKNNSTPYPLLGERGSIRDLKILIAEDDKASEMLISSIVEDFCPNPLIATTGEEAVTICKENQDIDLIFMDIQMPDMNGYEATRQIRKFDSKVIIIAQTAYGLPGNKKESITAGCNEYITKPIHTDKLCSMLLKYFKKTRIEIV